MPVYLFTFASSPMMTKSFSVSEQKYVLKSFKIIDL